MGREEGSGWGTHVYLWRIHFDIWQNSISLCPASFVLQGQICLLLQMFLATHSNVLAWRIPGTVEPMGCCLCGRTESDTTEAT